MRNLVLLATGAVWAVMVAGLVQREVVPYLTYQAPPSYKAIFHGKRAWEFTAADLTFAGEPCGSLESLSGPGGGLGGGMGGVSYGVLHFTARVRAPGQDLPVEIPMRILSRTMLDELYQLESIKWLLQGPATISADGRRTGDLLHIDYRVTVPMMPQLDRQGRSSLEFPHDSMLGDSFQPYPGGGRMHLGKRWKMTTIIPELDGFRMGYLYAVVTARETFIWQGREINGFRVEVRKKVTEDDLPTHILQTDEDGTAYIQRMTYKDLEYVITLRERREIEQEERQEWIRKWELQVGMPGRRKRP